MSDALARLTDYGTSLVATLQDAIRTKPVTKFGPVNASGRLADSLRFEAAETSTGYRLSLYAASYALTLEYGRKPGKFPNLTAIKQWIQDKGIVPRPDANGRPTSADQLAFLIGRKIANSGTTIWQAGQPTGLFGQVIGENVPAEQLAKLLLPVFVDEVRSVLRAA